MNEACTVNFLFTAQWLAALYLAIGIAFATAGLGIALGSCKHRHNIVEVSGHVQGWIVEALTWPWKVAMIRRIAHEKLAADIRRNMSDQLNDEQPKE